MQETGCHVADLAQQNIFYETLDGTHPTKLGHKEIADAWKATLSEMFFTFYPENLKKGKEQYVFRFRKYNTRE